MSVVLLRHAWAGHRHEWTGHDVPRPLDERGLQQARALRDGLSDRGIVRIVSSPYRRCVETVEPLAEALGLTVELDDRLGEDSPAVDSLQLLTELDGGLACTHGNVIEAVLGRGLKKGAAVVIDVRRDDVVLLEKLSAP